MLFYLSFDHLIGSDNSYRISYINFPRFKKIKHNSSSSLYVGVRTCLEQVNGECFPQEQFDSVFVYKLRFSYWISLRIVLCICLEFRTNASCEIDVIYVYAIFIQILATIIANNYPRGSFLVNTVAPDCRTYYYTASGNIKSLLGHVWAQIWQTRHSDKLLCLPPNGTWHGVCYKGYFNIHYREYQMTYNTTY